MEQIDNKWVAQDGCFFVRTSDNKIMGDTLFLGEVDTIENYQEVPVNDQEREEFIKRYSFGCERAETELIGPSSQLDTENF